MHAVDDSQDERGVKDYRPRFSMKRLLQGMTLAALVIALFSQGPMWGLILAARVSGAVILGALIALAFVREGRVRIACIAALAAHWPFGGLASVGYAAQSFGLTRLPPRFSLLVGMLFLWGGAAIAAATAYWAAGWFSQTRESPPSSGVSSSDSD